VSDAINPALAEALKSEAVLCGRNSKHNSTMWMRTNGRKRLAPATAKLLYRETLGSLR